MDLKCHSQIAIDGEEIVHVNYAIFPTGHKKSTIRRELCTHNIIRMPVFILFKQNKGLKGSPEGRTLIYHESMGLSNTKKFPIITKTSCVHRALKIIFRNGEHALDIKNHSISNNINGNQDNSRRMDSNGTNLVMCLEWKYAGSIIFKINLLDIVEDRREQSITIKCNIATHVGTAEQVLCLHSIVEHHG